MNLTTIIQSKVVPLVFYSCDEDNYNCSYHIWQSITKCLNDTSTNSSLWSLFDVKKTFQPKLVSLLRRHANGNANSQNISIVFSSLLLVISKISKQYTLLDEKLNFYNDFYSRFYNAVQATTNSSGSSVKLYSNQNATNHRIVLNSFIDCVCFAADDLLKIDDKNALTFCFETLIMKYVASMCTDFLDNSDDLKRNQQQQQRFNDNNRLTNHQNEDVFIKKINLFLTNIIERIKETNLDYYHKFWSTLSEFLLKKYPIREENIQNEQMIININKYLTILTNCSRLSSHFWSSMSSIPSKENTSSTKHPLEDIIQKILTNLTNDFEFHLKQEKHQDVIDINNDLCFLYLKCMNVLCRNHCRGIAFNSSERRSDEFIQKSLKRSLERIVNPSDYYLTFSIVDLFVMKHDSEIKVFYR
jgi:hypothetical protein